MTNNKKPDIVISQQNPKADFLNLTAKSDFKNI